MLDHQADGVSGYLACRYALSSDSAAPLAIHYTEHELQATRFGVEEQREALRESRCPLGESPTRFFDRYNQAPAGYCTLNENGQIIEANLGAATLLGVSQNALVGRTLSSFVFDSDSDACLLRQKLIDSSEAQAFALRILRSDGTQFWAHLAIVAVQGARGARCHRVVLSDIGERKKDEETLPVSKQKATAFGPVNSDSFRQAVLDSVSSQIAVLDERGVIVAVNAAWLRFAEENGMSPEQAARHTGIGVSYLDACQPDSSHAEASALAAHEGILKVLDGRLPGFFLEYACHSPHQQRWFTMSVTLLDGEDGGGVVVTHTDITDSKEKLRALAAHQEQLLEQERKHIAMEVHDEMGRLLTVLGLNTSLIGLRFGKDPELLEMIEQMRSHVDSATTVVRRIASNLRPAALDLGLLPALEWLAEDFSRHWSTGCSVDGGNANIELDDLRSTAVFRVVQESLTNVARHANAKTVAIIVRQNKQQLRVIVKDDGRGFDATAVGDGIGFGLFGMRERLLALGGTLRVESTPGKGTAVTIELPRHSK